MLYSQDGIYAQAISVPDDVGPAVMGKTPLLGTLRRQAGAPVLRDMVSDVVSSGSNSSNNTSTSVDRASTSPDVDTETETQSVMESGSDSISSDNIDDTSVNVTEHQTMSAAAEDKMEMKNNITEE